jgi:hypothetical protein
VLRICQSGNRGVGGRGAGFALHRRLNRTRVAHAAHSDPQGVTG